ncbi:MAG TPA: hypothetical protein VMW17_02945 [Candidatus Binatia bacterium]|nr:hypothetical protein [Candidatus Binatia bacterium]
MKAQASRETRAAAQEILAAITNGTRVMPAPAFFRGLRRQLSGYKADRYPALIKWLGNAGIQHLPSKEQCAAAAKLARRKHSPLVSPHPVADY